MASVIMVELESGRSGYAQLARMVRQYGVKRSPRGRSTYDAGHVVVEVLSPYDALPIGVGRQLNPAIAAGEAVQLVAGRARHDLMPRITPAFRQYAEPNGRFHGAYGDRVGDQVHAQLVKLKRDRESRQAVVTLWNPSLDNDAGLHDYPCTVTLNFAILADKLELRTLMRSNDVWLGWPYDIFQFSQLLLTAARSLDIEPGKYTHTAWSLHLYEEHADLVDQLGPACDAGYQPTGFGYEVAVAGDRWVAYRARADCILAGDRAVRRLSRLTESERWYVDQLAPYTTT